MQVRDGLANLSPDSYDKVVSHFRRNVLRLIKENERQLVKNMLLLMIQEAKEIKPDTEVEVISGTKKADLVNGIDDLATFLAGLFLYALKNTDNNVGGKIKSIAKKYRERIVSGEMFATKEITTTSEIYNADAFMVQSLNKSREVELMEERISQEATAFLINHDQEKRFISLCQIANVTEPTIVHYREMYNCFCKSTESTRNKIIEMAEIKTINISNKEWWWEYLERFKKDYIEYKLGDISYLYTFGQYFHRITDYRQYSVKEYLKHVFPVTVKNKLLGFKSYKHDIVGLIDEYIYYNDFDEYKDKLEPPMDYLWRELELQSPSVTDDGRLAIILGLFIIGTCYSLPKEREEVLDFDQYNSPALNELETAEDLFYMTLLVLYETYN